MKKLFFTFFIALSAITLHATIYTVDNMKERNPEQKLYPTIQEAHNAASTGDTLMIVGNGWDHPYSNSTITRKLIIIGPGYYLSENSNTRQGKMEAYLNDITFSEGSSFSKLFGICNTHSSNADIRILTDNIEISFCKLDYIDINSYSNTTITRNTFVYVNSWNVSGLVYNNNDDAPDGLFVANNIFYGSCGFVNGAQGEVRNNIFHKLVNIDGTKIVFRNNIILTESKEQIYMDNMIEGDLISNSNYTNNLAFLNIFVEGDGYNNQSEITLSEVFENNSLPSFDKRFEIKAGGLADNKGHDGTDIGIFGGSAPYQLSGIVPSLPTITEIVTTGVGSIEQGLPIKVTIK